MAADIATESAIQPYKLSQIPPETGGGCWGEHSPPKHLPLQQSLIGPAWQVCPSGAHMQMPWQLLEQHCEFPVQSTPLCSHTSALASGIRKNTAIKAKNKARQFGSHRMLFHLSRSL